eukprot:364987-Chlamydomonas_euryale.AAC.2
MVERATRMKCGARVLAASRGTWCGGGVRGVWLSVERDAWQRSWVGIHTLAHGMLCGVPGTTFSKGINFPDKPWRTLGQTLGTPGQTLRAPAAILEGPCRRPWGTPGQTLRAPEANLEGPCSKRWGPLGQTLGTSEANVEGPWGKQPWGKPLEPSEALNTEAHWIHRDDLVRSLLHRTVAGGDDVTAQPRRRARIDAGVRLGRHPAPPFNRLLLRLPGVAGAAAFVIGAHGRGRHSSRLFQRVGRRHVQDRPTTRPMVAAQHVQHDDAARGLAAAAPHGAACGRARAELRHDCDAPSRPAQPHKVLRAQQRHERARGVARATRLQTRIAARALQPRLQASRHCGDARRRRHLQKVLAAAATAAAAAKRVATYVASAAAAAAAAAGGTVAALDPAAAAVIQAASCRHCSGRWGAAQRARHCRDAPHMQREQHRRVQIAPAASANACGAAGTTRRKHEAEGAAGRVGLQPLLRESQPTHGGVRGEHTVCVQRQVGRPWACVQRRRIQGRCRRRCRRRGPRRVTQPRCVCRCRSCAARQPRHRGRGSGRRRRGRLGPTQRVEDVTSERCVVRGAAARPRRDHATHANRVAGDLLRLHYVGGAHYGCCRGAWRTLVIAQPASGSAFDGGDPRPCAMRRPSAGPACMRRNGRGGRCGMRGERSPSGSRKASAGSALLHAPGAWAAVWKGCKWSCRGAHACGTCICARRHAECACCVAQLPPLHRTRHDVWHCHSRTTRCTRMHYNVVPRAVLRLLLLRRPLLRPLLMLRCHTSHMRYCNTWHMHGMIAR